MTTSSMITPPPSTTPASRHLRRVRRLRTRGSTSQTQMRPVALLNNLWSLCNLIWMLNFRVFAICYWISVEVVAAVNLNLGVFVQSYERTTVVLFLCNIFFALFSFYLRKRCCCWCFNTNILRTNNHRMKKFVNHNGRKVWFLGTAIGMERVNVFDDPTQS